MRRLLIALLLAGSAAAAPWSERLGVGINFGNALEAPREGAWGLRLEEGFFPVIRAAGFRHVRIPVRWSAHAAMEAPYTIDEAFFRRVDWAVDQALSNDLRVVLNMHHYDEIFEDPAAHRARFLGLWKQIASRYAARPDDRLLLELLNEPSRKLDDALWGDMQMEAIALVRKTNPRRTVVITPTDWSSFKRLSSMKLPADTNVLVTFHYYLPFHFTHQGASWVGGESAKWLGTTWNGTDKERAAILADLDGAAAWARANGRELYLGEFGAYGKADMASRERWTRFVREAARQRGMAAAYWEFGSGFGAYDPKARAWREPLLRALTGP